MKANFKTDLGVIQQADALDIMPKHSDCSVNLIVTSPPFGLVRKKDYGNADADEYLEWFRPFAKEFYRILANDGSLVIDIGVSWIKGQPTRSLYHFELLLMLCKEYGFHLAQEFYWWNPSKLPTPAEWVNIRRLRVKDAVNCVWWLSKTPWPKASNRRVLTPYSRSQMDLFKNGYKAKKRPSGHNISKNFDNKNKGSIPPNLIAVANTESNSSYLKLCQENGIKPHPARFPADIPEYFVRMLTDKGDLVLDPFAGSCVTGEVCERLKRKWICIEEVKEYVEGAKLRFSDDAEMKSTRDFPSYSISHPATLWNGTDNEAPLPEDGGRSRPKK
jgi:site-specific DNA-methyltransferase (cytosine-N4-specific)